jgi:hypothetical protein
VFGLLCRLTADRRQAEWLTARVLASGVYPSQALDEARRLYVLDNGTKAAGTVHGDDPIAAMAPEARVADERNPESPNASLWRGRDLWLDDDTRQRIRDLTTTVPASAGGASSGGGSVAAPMSPRRKRTLIVSAGLTVAVLAAMVASSSTSSDNDALGEDGFTPTSASAPGSGSTDTTDSTEDTRGTVPITEPFVVEVETTVRASIGPPGFILDDDPEGMQFTGAWENGDAGGGTSGWVQLWASPDADRNAGRWAVIATADGDLGFFCCDVRVDGTRLDMAGAPALVSTSPDGVLDVVTVTTEQEQINIRSYGLTMDEITRLVVGIGAVGNEEPVLDADALAVLDGSSHLMSRQGGWGRADGALSDDMTSRGLSFVQVDEPHGYAFVGASPATSTSMLVARLLLQRPIIEAAPGGTVTIAGHEVLVSINQWSEDQLPTYQLQYIDGEDFVTVGGQIDFGTLVSIVSDARRASEHQWQRTLARDPVMIDVSGTGLTPMQPGFRSAGTTEIGDERWGIAVSADPRAVQVSIDSEQFSGGGPIAQLDLDERPVQYLAALEVTLVVAIVANPGAATSVLFTPEGVAPSLVLLRELTGGTTSAASLAYATYGPCLVQLVDANGAILGELTP